MQRRSISGVAVRLYDDLRILIERHEEAEKTLNGKLPEFAAQHLRYIGLANSEQIGGFHLFQAAIFHDRVDLEYKLRLDQMLFCTRHTDPSRAEARWGVDR